jgi:VWFA-related protein
MNKKNPFCFFALKLCLGLLIFIGLNLPVLAQEEKEPKRKKFGWSLKKAKKESENDSKPKKNNKKNNNDEDELIKINTDLILNDLLVLNEKGEAVLGLKESDFVIIEDDKPQKIEVFSSPAAEKPIYPRHFVFIIDHSNSNVGHIENSINAAKLFVDKLNPQDKMAIVTDDVKLIQDFTNDKAKLKNKLDWVYKDFISVVGRWGGWGLTYTALNTVLNELFDRENIRPIIILQSNGSELELLKGGKQDGSQSKFGLYYGFYNVTFQELLAKIIEKRATVYSIVTGRRFAGVSDEEKIKNMQLLHIDYQYGGVPVKLRSITPRPDDTIEEENVRRSMEKLIKDQLALIEIAETSGGTVKFLQTPKDAQNVYSDIFADVVNRYLIGYYSNNQDNDKKIRKVKIQVLGHPEYAILGRKSYIAR